MNIPIDNIFYLLCYAWNHVQERDIVSAGAEEFREPADLFGHVLGVACSRLVSRGLDRNYVSAEGPIRGIRGKVNIGSTVRRQLQANGQAYCHYDEFHHDILMNQIIRATLDRMFLLQNLHPSVATRLRNVRMQFTDVSQLRLNAEHFRLVQVHRNNRGYDFVLKLCRLIYDNLLVNESDGRAKFHDFRYDDATMETIFEQFLFYFFKREQNRFRVSRPHIEWFRAECTDHDRLYLPIMRTDLVLGSAQRHLVIDAKFYRQALAARFNAEKVRSGHLYQILSYLDNIRPAQGSQGLEGFLLYPDVTEPFDLKYVLNGRPVRVLTIDLNQPWSSIHADLLSMIN